MHFKSHVQNERNSPIKPKCKHLLIVHSLGGWNTGIGSKDNIYADLKPGRKMFSMYQFIQIHLNQPLQMNDSIVTRMKIEWKTSYVKQPVQTKTPNN